MSKSKYDSTDNLIKKLKHRATNECQTKKFPKEQHTLWIAAERLKLLKETVSLLCRSADSDMVKISKLEDILFKETL